MDPKTRFLSALAIATASMAMTTRGHAQTSSETELYNLCVLRSADACSTFLQIYPDSIFAPQVMALAIELGAPDSLFSVEPAAGPAPTIY